MAKTLFGRTLGGQSVCDSSQISSYHTFLFALRSYLRLAPPIPPGPSSPCPPTPPSFSPLIAVLHWLLPVPFPPSR